MRVLIVDDELTIREFFTLMARNRGCDTAHSVEDLDGSTTFVNVADADLLIREDTSGAVLMKGKGSVLVEGNLTGEPDTSCRIEVYRGRDNHGRSQPRRHRRGLHLHQKRCF